MNNKKQRFKKIAHAALASFLCAATLNATWAQESPPSKTAVTFGACEQAQHGTTFYGAQCAKITLPATTASPEATLNLLKARARSTPTQDPLVVITGGPGTSAVSLAWQYLRFFYAVQKKRDILFIDQRGTGKSAPFSCESVNDIDQTLPSEQLVAAMNTALVQCAGDYDSPEQRLTAITTRQAALDIEAVRKQLGYAQLNLWGSSYGTRVAMEYQYLFPQTSRTVIIDGVAPGAIALPRHAEYDAALALQQLFSACQAQPECLKSFGDLHQKWQHIIANLTKTPSNAELFHPRTQEALSTTITAPLVANWVRFALYNRELSALLPMAINAAFEGNYRPLSNLAQIASDSVHDGMSYGMHAAILCAEDSQAPHLPRNQQALPTMPFSAVNDLSPACQALPKADSNSIQSLFSPINSATPTLITSGQFDPVTPPFWGDWASQNMTNAKHIVVPGGHHGVTGVGCIPKLMAQFIESAQLDALDTSCVEHIKPVDFFIDNAGPALKSTDLLLQTDTARSPNAEELPRD